MKWFEKGKWINCVIKWFLLAKNLYHDWISAIDISVWMPFSLFISKETWSVNKGNEMTT